MVHFNLLAGVDVGLAAQPLRPSVTLGEGSLLEEQMIGWLYAVSTIAQFHKGELLLLLRHRAKAVVGGHYGEEVLTVVDGPSTTGLYPQFAQIVVEVGAPIGAVTVPPLGLRFDPFRCGIVPVGERVQGQAAVDCPALQHHVAAPHPSRNRDQTKPDGGHEPHWLTMREGRIDQDVLVLRQGADGGIQR